MATLGPYRIGPSGGGTTSLWLYLDYTETVNTTANTSSIAYTFYIRKDTAGNFSANSTTWNLTVGTAHSGTYGAISGGGIGQTWVLAQSTDTVTHNADGTKSITLSGSISCSNGAVGSLSQTIALTNIARQSTVSVSSSSVAVNSSVTINIARASGTSYTHNLWWKGGSVSSWTSITTGVGTSHLWTLPTSSMLSAFPTTTSGTITILCRTFSGSTQIGSDTTCTFTATIPDSYKPSQPTFNPSDTKGFYATYGAWIQGQSQLSLTVSSTAGTGSSMNSYTVQVTGGTPITQSSSSFSGIALPTSGTITITATATDKRGRSNSRSSTISVTPYANVSISNTSTAVRSNASGVTDETLGTCIHLTATTTYTAIAISGKTPNTLTITVKTKKSSDSAYTSQGTISANANVVLTNGSTGFSTQNTYDILIEAADKFTSTSLLLHVSSAKFPIDVLVGGNGIAFGKPATEPDTIDTNWKFRTSNSDGEIVNISANKVSYEISGNAKEKSWSNILNPQFSTLLWTNPNPLSSYGANTLSLSLSDYNFLIIVARHHTNVGIYYSTLIEIGLNGGSLTSISGSNGYQLSQLQVATRKVDTTTSSVKFYEAHYTNGSGNNAIDNLLCIPYKIYGVNL